MDQTARRRTTIQIRGAGTALSVFRLIASSYRNRRRNHPRKPLKVLTVRAPSIDYDTPVKRRDHEVGHRLSVYARWRFTSRNCAIYQGHYALASGFLEGTDRR